MFESILGNEPIKVYLRKAMESNRLPQTLLFSGIDGIGKSLFAKALGAELLKAQKSHDFYTLKPESKSGLYIIDTLREMIEKDHAAPFEGVGKVFLLEDAHRMQSEAANILLKTLEEPSDDSTFILLTDKMHEILPTILSRCSIVQFRPLKLADIKTLLHEKGIPIEFAKLSHGSVGRAFRLKENGEFEEKRKILFKLLETSNPYPELFLELGQLEKLVEKWKVEDPVFFAAQVEDLFTLILMWHRDQNLRGVSGGEHLLFFPDIPTRTPVPMEKIQKSIERARLAFARNMKLSHCLIEAFRTMQA